MIIIIFVPNDNRKDDSRCTFLIAIGHKSGYNNKSNRFYINNLKEMSNLKNRFIFYYKIINKYILASIIFISIVIDIPFTNHSSENSIFISIYNISYKIKDMKDKLLSYLKF